MIAAGIVALFGVGVFLSTNTAPTTTAENTALGVAFTVLVMMGTASLLLGSVGVGLCLLADIADRVTPQRPPAPRPLVAPPTDPSVRKSFGPIVWKPGSLK